MSTTNCNKYDRIKLVNDDNYRYNKLFAKRKKYRWVNDDSVKVCYNCDYQFTIWARKHHCRLCGNIFCSSCSEDIVNIDNENKRSCKNCYIEHIENEKIQVYVDIIYDLELNINDIKNLSICSKKWNVICKQNLSYIRNLLFYNPDQEYNSRSINILLKNLDFFGGHSCWLVQLIKCSEFINNQKDIDLILGALYKPKITSCNNLMCNNCSTKLTLEHAILCIYPYLQNNKILKFLYYILADSPINEINCYIPIFVYIMRFYHNKSPEFIAVLFNIFSLNYSLSCKLFWELTLQSEDPEYNNLYILLRKKFIGLISHETSFNLENMYKFINNINSILKIDRSTNEIKTVLNNHIETENYFINNISLPICPNNLINGIDVSNISVKNSATKPTLIPLKSDNELKVLFKNEDLRKDHIVINIIKLMNIFLKNDGLDLNIVEYDIFSYNSKCGYVEIVNNSDTIYNITEVKNFSIQNFILENNDNEQIDVIKDNFVNSCAAYCVISYLLGFGDRHLDNIMITKRGFLFHIDFGFILGKDPKLIVSEIRITNDMIDVMGGMNSKYYQKFKKICNESFNCLRKHSSVFEILLSFVYLYKPCIDNGSYTKELVYNHIINRFIPDETQDEAIIHIESKMSNRSTYSEHVIDFFHHAAKKNSEEEGYYIKKMFNFF